jgi:hypothetical protein
MEPLLEKSPFANAPPAEVAILKGHGDGAATRFIARSWPITARLNNRSDNERESQSRFALVLCRRVFLSNTNIQK